MGQHGIPDRCGLGRGNPARDGRSYASVDRSGALHHAGPALMSADPSSIAAPAPIAPATGVAASVGDTVTPYHWLVVIIASAGWLFDCMDQRLFILGRESALRDLMQRDPELLPNIKTHIGYATTSMILGWATGGIIFGVMSDKMGRVKTMVATLIVYSGFTGLSGTANSITAFLTYRF